MVAPGTRWKERVGADEAMRHGLYAREFEAIQALKSAQYGKGRALHRKQRLGLHGSFDVLPRGDAGDWPEDVAPPYVTVGVLTLPVQDTQEAVVEAAVFDPWRALMAHRPLGDVMRARRVVYYQSQNGRK